MEHLRFNIKSCPSRQCKLASLPLCDFVETVRSNPFCTRFVRPGSLDYRFGDPANDGQDRLQLIVEELKRVRTGLILGPHGSGKTTLLHSLGPLLADAFEHIASVQLFAPTSTSFCARLEHARRIFRTVSFQQAGLFDGGLLIIDGAEQLWRVDTWRLIRRALRRGQAILVTSHTPIRGLTTIHQSQVNDSLIRELTEALLANEPSEVSDLVRQQLCERDLTKLSNVRELWFELYDLVQPQFTDRPAS
jgi:energy-coupling factor transporter ATP-binding protein EcfA2